MNIKFVKGAIGTDMLLSGMETIQRDGHIGAQSFFMGHIRADHIELKEVVAIDYTAYEPMAMKVFEKIYKDAKAQFDLTEINVFHSLGKVGVGEASLLVITLSKHRRASLDGLNWIVEAIKKDVPIFAKEVLEDGDYEWKVNR